jgi:hypothetical protein
MLTYALPATTTNFILLTPIEFVMVDGNTYVNNKEFLCITRTVEQNYISPSSTTGWNIVVFNCMCNTQESFVIEPMQRG